MIPSKEDILSRVYLKQTDTETNIYAKEDFADTVKSGIYDFALKAMDEYAKEIAIGFAKWLNEKHYQHSESPDKLFSYYTDDNEAVPIKELFNQYLQTLQP